MSTVSRPVLAKAYSPMDFNLNGRVRLLSLEHSSNALSPTMTSISGRESAVWLFTCSSAVHP